MKKKKTIKPGNGLAQSDIEKRAIRLASTYSFKVTPRSDGRFDAHGIELPLVCVVSEGETIVSEMAAALTAAVFSILSQDQRPPSLAKEQKSEVVNIRMSAGEKALMETRARKFGFKGVSDFLRSISIE